MNRGALVIFEGRCVYSLLRFTFKFQKPNNFIQIIRVEGKKETKFVYNFFNHDTLSLWINLRRM